MLYTAHNRQLSITTLLRQGLKSSFRHDLLFYSFLFFLQDTNVVSALISHIEIKCECVGSCTMTVHMDILMQIDDVESNSRRRLAAYLKLTVITSGKNCALLNLFHFNSNKW